MAQFAAEARQWLTPQCCEGTTIASDDVVLHVRDFSGEGIREEWGALAKVVHLDAPADYYAEAVTQERAEGAKGRVIVLFPPPKNRAGEVAADVRNASAYLSSIAEALSAVSADDVVWGGAALMGSAPPDATLDVLAGDWQADFCALAVASHLVLARKSTFSRMAALVNAHSAARVHVACPTWPAEAAALVLPAQREIAEREVRLSIRANVIPQRVDQRMLPHWWKGCGSINTGSDY